MAEGDSAAVDVDFVHVEAEFADAVYGLSCESFIQFDEVHLVDVHAGLLHDFADCRNRASTHDCRFNTSRSPVDDASQRFDAEFFSFFSGHYDNSSCAVVDAGSVTSGNCAVFDEGRTEFSQCFHGAVRTDEFVFVDDDIAFSLMDRYRNDLAVEFAFLLSFVSQVFRTASQLILVFTGYTEASGNVFSRYAHVVVVFRAEQAIAHEQVFEDAVAHTIAAAAFSDGVGGVGHGFHTTGYDDVSIAEFDLLGSEGNGTHTGTAEFI